MRFVRFNTVVRAGVVVCSIGMTSALAGEFSYSCEAVIPGVFQLQVIDVSVCKDEGCADSASLVDNGAVVDVGSDNAEINENVATLPGSGEVPPGIYNFLRILAGLTIAVNAEIDVSGGGFCRTPGTSTDGISLTTADVPASAATTEFELPANLDVTFAGGATMRAVGGQLVVTIPLAPPLVVDIGDAIPVPEIDVNINEAVVNLFNDSSDCGFGLTTPSLTVRFDGQTYELTDVDVDAVCTAIDSTLDSDYAVKTDIELIARLSNGLGVYRYHYVWGGPTYIGAIAQEVAEIVPEALVEQPGFLKVNYARLMADPVVREEVGALFR